MGSVLLVHYLPSRNSKTKELVTHLKQTYTGKIQELDLVKHTPDLFLKDNLNAYVKRNYKGKKLTPKETKLLTTMDRMTEQFTEADTIIVAYPMHNFSMPAVMKAYFDTVMQKGETWDIDEDYGHHGLMQGRKALIISSSGHNYPDEEDIHDCSVRLPRTLFGFMEFDDVQIVRAQGLDEGEQAVERNMRKAKKEIEKIAKKWL